MDTGNHAKNHRAPVVALRAARELIADPERWTRSAPARRWKAPQKREPGAWVPTHATDPYASRWCAAGALCAVSGIRSGAPGITFLEAASRQLFGVGIGRANDDARLTTHADILRCLDLAITLVEAAADRTRGAAKGQP
jgi:hypothetical protein